MKRILFPWRLILPIFIVLLSGHAAICGVQGIVPKVTLNGKDISLSEVFKSIKKQTGLTVFYSNRLLNDNERVSMVFQNADVNDVLSFILKDKNLDYILRDQLIIIEKKKPALQRRILQNNQQQKIKGTVTDVKGESLPGVSINIKGTTTGTITDLNGNYTISVPQNAILVFTNIAYITQEIVVTTQTTINVKLLEKYTSLNEVVVTGYSAQRKADLTGAVAVVKMDDVKDNPSGSIMQSLQGKVAGIYITTNGNPTGRATIDIRGLSTLGSNTTPLYVIDGTPTSDGTIFQNMDPNIIQSMQVLKDASSASIYGSRASAGVIIITTKNAKDGVSVEFNSSLSTQKRTRKLSMLNTLQYGQALWQATVNDKTNPSVQSALYTYNWNNDFNNPILYSVTPTTIIGGDPTLVAGDTDWQKELFQTGLVTSNSLTISAGSPKSSMLIGLTYFKGDGLIIHNNFKRYTGQINTSTKMFDGKFKIGENLQLNKSAETPVVNDLGGASVLSLATTILPILPVYKTDGTFAGPLGAGFSDRDNPIHIMDINQDDKNNNFQAFGNIYAEISPVKNLLFRSSLGLDYGESYNVDIERTFVDGFISRSVNSMGVNQSHNLNTTFSNTLNYNLNRKHSRSSFLIGMEAINNSNYALGATRQGFAVQDVSYFAVSAGTGMATNTGSQGGNQLLSYFAKTNYTLNEKYLLALTMRYDGSSRFGDNNKFGLFPAASLGWIVSSEPFIMKNAPFISNLKLRAGVGQVGNQNINNNAIFQLYQTAYNFTTNQQVGGTAYDINGANTGTLPSGYVKTQTANPNLKWETTTELNMGVDFAFFQDKISGSFDYFIRNTKDILVTPPVAAVVGEGSAKTQNGATMANRGWEFNLGYNNAVGQFRYGLTGNIAHTKDKITYLPTAVIGSFPGTPKNNILGHSVSSIFGYVADGLFQNQQEVTSSATQPGKGIGRIRFADLNNDGVINVNDQTWLGTTLPNFNYGLTAQMSYKNVGIVVAMRGLQGVIVNDGSKTTTDFMGNTLGVNKGTRLLDAWTPTNTSSTIPAASLGNANNELRTSTYLLVNGSYFKVQNVQLNYSVPVAAAHKLGLQSIRVYAIGDNVFLQKDKSFTGPDPETPGTVYPRPVKYTLGIDLKF